MIEQLMIMARRMVSRFPDGNDPFQMMTRLLEESGELAQQVNHFEGAGVKREKYGEPDRKKLAKEVMQVMRCALQVAVYYDIETEVEEALDASWRSLKAEGHIKE